MREPWVRYFAPFGKVAISISVSRSKPRGWYGWVRAPGGHNKDTHFFSICRVDYSCPDYQGDSLSAYRLIIGPLQIMVGF